MTDTTHFFVYAPQRRCVTEDLLRMGLAANPRRCIHGVDEANWHMMAGMPGVFVINATHPAQPPQQLIIRAQAHGFTFLTLDDFWLRQRYSRERVG